MIFINLWVLVYYAKIFKWISVSPQRYYQLLFSFYNEIKLIFCQCSLWKCCLSKYHLLLCKHKWWTRTSKKCVGNWNFQSSEVHATCCPQANGEHAHALGANSRCSGPVPHHRGHFLCQPDTLGHRACLHCSVGVSPWSVSEPLTGMFLAALLCS